MLEPRQPVEDRRPDRFLPPHCPHRDCPAHRIEHGFRFKRDGRYAVENRRRRIQRFACHHCGRRFSQQSFSCTYFAKRPELVEPVARGLVAGCAHRQIAQILDCAPSTVTRLAARIGRHCLLFQHELRRSVGPPPEPVVADHFETFCFSQLDRLGIATSVGHRSWFGYGFEPAPHRGSSTRAARKRPVRSPLTRTAPGAVTGSMRDLLGDLVFPGAALELLTDDHPGYPAAVAAHGRRVRHVVHPNPARGPGADAERARARDRAMFPVDLLHGLLRHGQARHKRETIAFGRRANATMEALATFTVWRNTIKGRSERKPDRTTPAMALGILGSRLTWRAVFARRLFPDRCRLSPSWRRIYRRELITPAVGRNLRHERRYAY